MAFLPISYNGDYIQVFTPRVGATLTSPYTPTDDEVVMLGAAVTITLDSKAIAYSAGDVIGLRGGETYTLSASTDVHKM